MKTQNLSIANRYYSVAVLITLIFISTTIWFAKADEVKNPWRLEDKLLLEALAQFKKPGTALDLGQLNQGRHALMMLEKRWKVFAVDTGTPEKSKYLYEAAFKPPITNPNLLIGSTITIDFEETLFPFIKPVDLVHTQLFFSPVPKEYFAKIWPLLLTYIKPGGILATQLSGYPKECKDEAERRKYNKNYNPKFRSEFSIFSVEEVKKMLTGFEIIKLEEIQDPARKETIIQLIVRKRRD